MTCIHHEPLLRPPCPLGRMHRPSEEHGRSAIKRPERCQGGKAQRNSELGRGGIHVIARRKWDDAHFIRTLNSAIVAFCYSRIVQYSKYSQSIKGLGLGTA